jgi:hypothetical protein
VHRPSMRRPVGVNLFFYDEDNSSLLDLNEILGMPGCFCRHPSIRTLSELLIARCKLGVLDSAGAATCYCDLPLDRSDEVSGQGNDAVTGTRLVSSNLHTSGRTYATAGSVIRLLGRNGT